ncbi:MAG: type II secretion system protein GspM [Desulfobulbaceae bacterium]|nr:type II secretion system protein GspM [Desulfobulbaceae bacterium]
MNQLIMLLKGLDRKILFLALGGLLLLLNLGRMSLQAYSNQIAEAGEKQNLLARYQETVNQLPALKKRVARLEQKSIKVEKYLFSGTSEEAVSSAMQIMLQELVTKAGLEPESIRPMVSGGTKTATRDYHEISIKIRLSGTLSQFVDFIAQLYRSDKLFQVESFTLKPYKKTEMKIFIDLKGFYTLKNG